MFGFSCAPCIVLYLNDILKYERVIQLLRRIVSFVELYHTSVRMPDRGWAVRGFPHMLVSLKYFASACDKGIRTRNVVIVDLNPRTPRYRAQASHLDSLHNKQRKMDGFFNLLVHTWFKNGGHFHHFAAPQLLAFVLL